MKESGRKEVNVVTLGRDNYARWRREIDAALRGHGLIWVADGTDKKPMVPAAADANHAARKKEAREWESADSKAQSIIMRTLDDMTFSHVADCVSAKTMMERISELRDPKTTDVLIQGSRRSSRKHGALGTTCRRLWDGWQCTRHGSMDASRKRRRSLISS